jgi:hydroxypyruvate reductase
MSDHLNSRILELRKNASAAFAAGVAAADPALALQSAISRDPIPAPLMDGSYFIISIGKAACKMAECAMKELPENADFTAIAVTNFENVANLDGCEVIGASHPVPCQQGFNASQKIIALLDSATEKDVVVMLVSGGSSALLPAPVEGITLSDKIAVNEALLASGFDIYETNLVRQSLSRLKGGGILKFAAPATVRSYILSDVLGDDLRVVGSGPSVGPLGTISQARTLLKARNVFTKLPETVQKYLETAQDDTPSPSTAHTNLIAGNANSVTAMAEQIGAQQFHDPLEGDVQEAAQEIINIVIQSLGAAPIALAFGGETTVKIAGKGKGGRNQELALRVACEMQRLNIERPWCFLSGGTDGRDGPTDAAGGLVDSTTLDRLSAKGKDVRDYLSINDSYHALELVDDLLMTGATGTNVADLQLLVIG